MFERGAERKARYVSATFADMTVLFDIPTDFAIPEMS